MRVPKLHRVIFLNIIVTLTTDFLYKIQDNCLSTCVKYSFARQGCPQMMRSCL